MENENLDGFLDNSINNSLYLTSSDQRHVVKKKILKKKKRCDFNF